MGCKYHGWQVLFTSSPSLASLIPNYFDRSYSSSTGALIKAPKFTGSSPTFKVEDNGLFRIHTHVTASGFIFINLDASPLPPVDIPLPDEEQEEEDISESESSSGSDSTGWRTPASRADGPAIDISIAGEELELELQAVTDAEESAVFTLPKRAATPPSPTVVDPHEYVVPFKEHFGSLPNEWDGFHPEEYEYAYSWYAFSSQLLAKLLTFNIKMFHFLRTRNGPYNWKTFMDGYQECYHCHVAHPGSSVARLFWE